MFCYFSLYSSIYDEIFCISLSQIISDLFELLFIYVNRSDDVYWLQSFWEVRGQWSRKLLLRQNVECRVFILLVLAMGSYNHLYVDQKFPSTCRLCSLVQHFNFCPENDSFNNLCVLCFIRFNMSLPKHESTLGWTFDVWSYLLCLKY